MPAVRLTLQAKQEFQNNTQQGLIYEQFKSMRPSAYNFIFGGIRTHQEISINYSHYPIHGLKWVFYFHVIALIFAGITLLGIITKSVETWMMEAIMVCLSCFAFFILLLSIINANELTAQLFSIKAESIKLTLVATLPIYMYVGIIVLGFIGLKLDK